MAEDLRLTEERRASEFQMTLKRIDVEKKDLQKRIDEKDEKIAGEEFLFFFFYW